MDLVMVGTGNEFTLPRGIRYAVGIRQGDVVILRPAGEDRFVADVLRRYTIDQFPTSRRRLDYADIRKSFARSIARRLCGEDSHA